MLVSSQKSAAALGSVVLMAIAFVACSSSQTVLNAGDTDGGTDGGLALKDGSSSLGDSGDVGGTCTPGDLSKYTYTAPGAARAVKSDCSTVKVDAFIDNCLAKATPSETDAALQERCKAWLAATENVTCGKCLLTTPTDPTGTGPLFGDPTKGIVVDLNIEGCIDHYEKGCGPAYIDFALCLSTACDRDDLGNCPASTTSEAQVAACEKAAMTDGCNARGRKMVESCKKAFPVSGAAPADVCLRATSDASLRTYVTRLANHFCNAGNTPTDAGTDASSDAGTDAARDATPN
jgi:hypothetical protein